MMMMMMMMMMMGSMMMLMTMTMAMTMMASVELEEWAFSAFNDGTCKESLALLVKRRGPGSVVLPDNIKIKSLLLSSSTAINRAFTF